jgi:ATP-dependent DNA helicase PIF1
MFDDFEYTEDTEKHTNKKTISFTPNSKGNDIFSFMKVIGKTSSSTIKNDKKIVPLKEEPQVGITDDLLEGLSEEQKLAFHKISEGENVFITGPGGTGKTFMLRRIHEYNAKNGKKMAVTAMTGCAALLLECNAKTLHSWSGIKLAKGLKEDTISRVIRSGYYKKNWKNASGLIIDEVSMMSQKVLEIIEEIARITKKNNKPFGGMQVIFIGDFFQLPPVENYGDSDSGKFCFESPIWNNIFKKENHIVLKTIFRQNDNDYIRILNEARQGELNKDSAQVLLEQSKKKCDKSDNIPTKLFPNRAKTDLVNNTMFSKIDKDDFIYTIETNTDYDKKLETGTPFNEEEIQKIKMASKKDLEMELMFMSNNVPCAHNLKLKIGCLVMCTINLDMTNGICNGSQGTIVDIVKRSGEFVPVVQFYNGIKREITKHYWQSEDYPCVAVGQYPLILAWALTIHKIQGATLSTAEIDIGNGIFEYGQSYVALSRVKSLEGLYLSSFNPDKVRANPIVKQFYSAL